MVSSSIAICRVCEFGSASAVYSPHEDQLVVAGGGHSEGRGRPGPRLAVGIEDNGGGTRVDVEEVPEDVEVVTAAVGLPVERNDGALLDEGGVLGDDVGAVEDALDVWSRSRKSVR